MKSWIHRTAIAAALLAAAGLACRAVVAAEDHQDHRAVPAGRHLRHPRARASGQKLHRGTGASRWWSRTSPGATGNIGADFVAKSPPDGYTLLLARHRLARDRARAS